MMWAATSDIENYLGFELISAPELVRKFQDQASMFGFEQFLGENASKIKKSNDRFLVTTSQATKIESNSLFISSGKRDSGLLQKWRDDLKKIIQ